NEWISNTGFPKEVIFPFPCAHAIHEIVQSYRDRVPVYNNIPDLEAQAFLSTIRVEINHPHLLAHEQFLDDGACVKLPHKTRSVFSIFLTYLIPYFLTTFVFGYKKSFHIFKIIDSIDFLLGHR